MAERVFVLALLQWWRRFQSRLGRSYEISTMPKELSIFAWPKQQRAATTALKISNHHDEGKVKKTVLVDHSGQSWLDVKNARRVQRCTVRLLTHVLCKPTHFFFHSFIATMSNTLQTSFNSLIKDWADKYHVWGTPTRSLSRSNSR